MLRRRVHEMNKMEKKRDKWSTCAPHPELFHRCSVPFTFLRIYFEKKRNKWSTYDPHPKLFHRWFLRFEFSRIYFERDFDFSGRDEGLNTRKHSWAFQNS